MLVRSGSYQKKMSAGELTFLFLKHLKYYDNDSYTKYNFIHIWYQIDYTPRFDPQLRERITPLDRGDFL